MITDPINQMRAKFVILFLAYIFILSIPMLADARWNNKNGTESYNAFIAKASASSYNFFSKNEVAARRDIVTSGAASVEIKSGCNGVLMAIIFLSAIAAFPAPASKKTTGILAGIFAIFLFNIARVDILFLILSSWPELFEIAHVTAAQFIGILFSITLWIFWLDGIKQK